MASSTDRGCDVSDYELDVGFRLPDVVYALAKSERMKRALYDRLLCVLDDERYFLRGIVFIPVCGPRRQFGWGLWAEVSQAHFERHRLMCLDGAPHEPAVSGVLANEIPGYGRLRHQKVRVVFTGANLRPLFVLLPSDTRLYRQQRDGVSEQELDRTLALNGYLRIGSR